jgi:four helix bundle protein
MANVRSFRDLIAYQRARALACAVHEHSLQYPRESRFELTSQVRRAAYSVPLNIAEGYGIGLPQATLRHLRIARGSLCETDAALEIASDLGFDATPPELQELLRETDRVLQGLIRSMEKPR